MQGTAAQYRAPFLYGVITDERHRLLAVQHILRAVGHAAELDTALGEAKLEPTVAVGAVQLRLAGCFERERASGELRVWWERWGMEATLDEWLLLATAPPQGDNNPVVRRARTPKLWTALNPLKVLMVHNTRLECYVSKQKQLRKGHNTTALMVNDVFMVHAQDEALRATLMAPEMRSSTGGARRKAALIEMGKGHALTDSTRSMAQRRRMLHIYVVDRLPKYSAARLYSRGKASIATAVRHAAAVQKRIAAEVVDRKVVAFQQTHMAGQSRARRPTKPPAAYAYLAPTTLMAREKAKKVRGTGHAAADIAKRTRKAAAVKAMHAPPPVPVVPRQPAKARPLSDQQHAKRKAPAQPYARPRRGQPPHPQPQPQPALTVQEKQALAQAREDEAKAASARVCAEMEAEVAMEEVATEEMAQMSEGEKEAMERVALRAALCKLEADLGRKLKGRDLRERPEVAVMYARYRVLCDK